MSSANRWTRKAAGSAASNAGPAASFTARSAHKAGGNVTAAAAATAESARKAEAEAAAARQEAERAAKAQQLQEQRRQQEEDRKQREADERQRAVKAQVARAEDDKRLCEERTALRSANSAASLPGADREAQVARLDSSIKKCSSLLRKLRALSEQPLASLLADLRTVNLAKYSSELIGALLDTPLRKREDVDKVVRVCSVMHQRHEGFSKQLLDAIEQRFFHDVRGRSSGAGGGGAGRKANSSATSGGGASGGGAGDTAVVKEEDGEEGEKRRRGMLRLLVEMLYVGLTDDARLVLDIVADAMQKDRHDSAQTLAALQAQPANFANLALLLSFLRYAGEEFANMSPRRPADLTDATTAEDTSQQQLSASSPPLLLCVPSDIRDKAHSMFAQYWTLASGRYAAVTSELQRKDKRLLRMELQRKDIDEAQRKERKQLRDNWDRLQTNLAQVAELLDRQLPAVEEEKEADYDDDDDAAVSLAVVDLNNSSTADGADAAGGAAANSSAPFDDDETKAFYTQLLDLTLVVPPMLLRDDRDDEDDDREEDDAKEAKADKEKESVKGKSSGDSKQQQERLSADAADKRTSRRRRRRGGGDDNDDGTCFPASDHELFTAEGFMSLQRVRQWFAAHDTLAVGCLVNGALQFHRIRQDRLIVQRATHALIDFVALATASAAGNQCTSDISLSVTPNHQMYVSVDGAPFAKVEAGEIEAGGREAAHTAIDLVTRFSAGMTQQADAEGSFRLLCLQLGLRTSEQVHAFLELYGYCLRQGELVCGPACIAIGATTMRAESYLDALFERLPLPRDQCASVSSGGYWKERDTGGVAQYCVASAAWCKLFSRQHGREQDDPSAVQAAIDATSTRSYSQTHRELHRCRLSGPSRPPNVPLCRSDSYSLSSTTQAGQRIDRSTDCFCPWVLQRDGTQLRSVVRGMLCAEDDWASVHKRATTGSILTTSLRFRDELVRVLLMAGYSVDWTVGHAGGSSAQLSSIGQQKDGWTVHFSTHRRSTLSVARSVSQRALPYTGEVWCVNVPTIDHLIMVRRVLETDAQGRVVRASRPVVVGNSDDLSIEQLERRLAAIQETKQQQEEEAADEEQPLSGSQPLDALFIQLRSAYSTEAIDSIATSFAYLNSRSNRTRLLSHLLHLPRSSLSLLPFAARLCAVLNQYNRDVGELLVSSLLDDFFRLLRRADKDRKLDYKVRNIRFLAELCKFGMCGSGVMFRCWKACLLSLAANSRDTVHTMAAMLEACGSYLYRQPSTHPRCAALIEQSRKLREPGGPLHNERVLSGMLDAALESCQPETAARPARQPKKERHVLELYARQLIFAELNPRNIERVATRLRKLPWTAQPQQQPARAVAVATATTTASATQPAATVAASIAAPASSSDPNPASPASSTSTDTSSDFSTSTSSTIPPPPACPPPPLPPPHIPTLILRCLSSPHLVSYSSLSSLASLSSSLNNFHPSLGVPLVDSVLEEVRCGLESNSFTQQQHRVTFVRYLAALFLCHMCDVCTVLDTLYLLIWYGQPQQQPQQVQPQAQPHQSGDVPAQAQSQPPLPQSTVGGDNRLDPTYDSFRLRLIVALLDGVAVFFTANASSQSAQSAQRLLRQYLLYLLRYVKLKEFVAFDVDQQLTDVMHKLGHSALKQLTWSQLQAQIAQVESARERGPDESGAKGGESNKAEAASPSGAAGATVAAASLSAGEEAESGIDGVGQEGDADEYSDEATQDGASEVQVQPEDLQAAAEEVAAERAVSRRGHAETEDAEAEQEEVEEDGEEEGEDAEEEEGDDEDDEDEEEDEEDDDDDDDEEEEEDDVWNRRRRTALSSEDASFERDFERLMADSIEQRRTDPRSQAIAPVESLLMAHGLQQSRIRMAVAARTSATSDDEEVVVFKLLTRDKAVRSGGDGSRVQERGVKELLVPVDSDMAVSSVANSKSMEEERRNVKRLVLAGLERGEREVLERERDRDRERDRGRKDTDRSGADRRRQQQPQQQSQYDRVAARGAGEIDEFPADTEASGEGDSGGGDRSSGRGRRRGGGGQAASRQAWDERTDTQQQQQQYSRRVGGGSSSGGGGAGQQRPTSTSSSASPTSADVGVRGAPATGPSTRPSNVSAQSNRTSAAVARSKADKNRGPRLDVASFAFLNSD